MLPTCHLFGPALLSLRGRHQMDDATAVQSTCMSSLWLGAGGGGGGGDEDISGWGALTHPHTPPHTLPKNSHTCTPTPAGRGSSEVDGSCEADGISLWLCDTFQH